MSTQTRGGRQVVPKVSIFVYVQVKDCLRQGRQVVKKGPNFVYVDIEWPQKQNTNLGPAVTLHFVFVISPSGFQHWFVNTATSGDDSNHSAIGRRNNLQKKKKERQNKPICIAFYISAQTASHKIMPYKPIIIMSINCFSCLLIPPKTTKFFTFFAELLKSPKKLSKQENKSTKILT